MVSEIDKNKRQMLSVQNFEGIFALLLPIKSTEFASDNFLALLLERASSRTAKERLWLLQGAWNWAKGKYHIAESNPWENHLKRIKPNETGRVKPFIATKIQLILNAFKSDRRLEVSQMNNLDIGDITKHPELGLGTVIEIQVRVIFYEESSHGVYRTHLRSLPTAVSLLQHPISDFADISP